ncbi:MAG TPA: glycosyltransferase family 4 protein [Thermoanaerobaculia bacterium]|nr:glycosyltransferase family 4 protein [Thermoanaerobaculia bacterium]
MAYRILMLSHHGRTVGGAALADRSLALALSRLGHDVDLLFFDDVLPRFVKATWRLLLFPWAAALALMRRRRHADYDVVEATAGDAWVSRALLRLAGGRQPLLSIRTHGLEHRRAEMDLERWHSRGTRIPLLTHLYHFRYRLWEVARDLRNADLVFLLNHEDAQFAVQRLKLAPERIHEVPNGVPEELLRVADPDGPEDRAFRLLFLGTWSAAKGADLLPRIAARLFRSDPRYRLTCAGVQVPEEMVTADFDPVDRPRLRVVTRYERADLPAILAEHGVFLFPSPAEGCSLALLEAMAGGLAPITTRTGYAAELIEPGNNGFLAEAGDVEGFVAPALRLAADPAAATEIGRSARRSVKNLTWEGNAAKRVRLWDSLLAHAPPG